MHTIYESVWFGLYTYRRYMRRQHMHTAPATPSRHTIRQVEAWLLKRWTPPPG